jgi:DNA-binding transcriptional ArsR family regulator
MRAGERGARPSQLLGEIGGAQNTLSSNLSVLRLAGLVTAWREGRSVYYRADAGLMLELTDFLTSGHLDAGVEASSAEPLKRAI